MPLDTDDPGPCPARARCQSAILAGAADLIERHGLAKGRRRGPGPMVSVEGALQQAYSDLGAVGGFHGWAPVRACEHRIRKVTGDRTVEQWSDHTHARDVVAKLRELASDARTDERRPAEAKV